MYCMGSIAPVSYTHLDVYKRQVYVVLTLVFAPLSFGEVQIRFSEALTVLPFFTPAAIPGLFVGCIIANLLGGAIPVDIIFGSIATLIGAFFTYKLRNTGKWTAPIPPIVSNIVIVPLVLRYGYGINLPIPFMMLTVGCLLYTSCEQKCQYCCHRHQIHVVFHSFYLRSCIVNTLSHYFAYFK